MDKLFIKLVLIFCLFLINLTLKANPVPPLEINEITQEDNHWQIELEILDSDYWVDVDSIRVITTSDTFYANSFPIVNQYYVVLDSTSLNQPLQINPEFEQISVEIFSFMDWDAYDNWTIDCSVEPLLPGQSYVNLWYSEYTHYLVKMSESSMGDANSGNCYGDRQLTFVNQDGESLSDVFMEINYDHSFTSNENGVMELELPAKNWNLAIEYQGIIVDNYVTSVEPDSYDEVEFVIDLSGVDENTIKRHQVNHYPNPFFLSGAKSSAYFNISMRTRNPKNDVEVCIYNTKGQIVKKLKGSSKKNNSYNFFWDGRNEAGYLQSSGVYFYNIKNRNEFIKTGKFTLVK